MHPKLALSIRAFVVATLFSSIPAQAQFLGFNNGLNYTKNGGATISGNTLTLTDNNTNEARSAFYNTKQDITSFTAQFIYQTTAGSAFPADGAVFVIQNSAAGPSALGAGGGNLGYNGIAPSVGLEFNLFTFNTIGIALHSNGGLGGYQSTAPVNIAGGDPINVMLVYSDLTNVLTTTLTDGSQIFTTTYSINIPTILGSNTAYIGFTGGTGSQTSTQIISDVSFDESTPEPGSLALLVGSSVAVSSLALRRRRTHHFKHATARDAVSVDD